MNMAQCTAPRNGHHTASGAANCPACRGGSRGYGGYKSYPNASYSTPSYSSSGSRRSGGRGSSSTAKELHDLLEESGVRVWFSEKDLGLGVPMMRAIDKGLVNSRIGIVLVTPAMLQRLPAEGVADKELSALLRRERLIPVAHGTTYEDLEKVSLLLASRAGLSTAEETMGEVAAKIAELVAI